jgi:D-alanine-D-alanine ligase
MHLPKHGVVVLHNVPRSEGGLSGIPWQESDAGVMDQVELVGAALQQLGVPHRTMGVYRLADIYRCLSGTAETIVFNLVEGLEGCYQGIDLVPAVVRSLNKACTGSDTPCLALCLDKWQTKVVLQAYGVPTPGAICVPVGRAVWPGDIPGGPLVVKPLGADGSEGIEIVLGVAGAGQDLNKAVRRIHEQFDQPALVEQFIDGREISVSLLQHADEVQVLPLAEVDFSGFPEDRPRILDYAAKWLSGTFQYGNTRSKIPADLQQATADEIRRLAVVAWKATGCKDYARIDVRIDHEGHPFVLEVNPNPDIGPGAGYAIALDAAHISYTRFVDDLLLAAYKRTCSEGENEACIGRETGMLRTGSDHTQIRSGRS